MEANNVFFNFRENSKSLCLPQHSAKFQYFQLFLFQSSKEPIKKQGGALNFKGLSQDGGETVFSESLRTSLFKMTTYLNNPLPARSISLDSTFK
jgi:hypothetical protein